MLSRFRRCSAIGSCFRKFVQQSNRVPRVTPSFSRLFLSTSPRLLDDNDDDNKPGCNKPSMILINQNVRFITIPAAFEKLSQLDAMQAEKEFLIGSKQALVTVSAMLSQGDYSNLHGILDDRLLEGLRERVEQLSNSEREWLKVDERDIQETLLYPQYVTHNIETGKLVFSVVYKGRHTRNPLMIGKSFLISFMFERCLLNDTGEYLIGFVMFFRKSITGEFNIMVVP